MKTLLQSAQERFDQVETYRIKEESANIQYQNDALQKIDNNIQSAMTLRVIKDKKLGFAYTRNLLSNEDLIKNAENSLLGEVNVEYQFPHSPLVEALDSYDPAIENLDAARIAEECQRLSKIIRYSTDAETDIFAGKDVTTIQLINSNGTDLSHKTSLYYLYFNLVYPGSASGISYFIQGKNFLQCEHEIIEKVIARYQAGNKIVQPQSGAMEVLFMPQTMYALTWRLALGTSSQSFYDKVTPIADKQEMKIFDNKLTFFTDPLDDRYPGSRPFDDEGVVCRRHVIINNGFFEKRFNDLNYAAKLKERPTGHGFRRSMTSLPAPSMQYLNMIPGHDSFADMIKGMDRGIILESILGAHSGNLANGDLSIGVAPALYVENGEIKGRLKEGMVSGNIYQILRKVEAVEDTLHPTGSGMLPSILLKDVHVDI